MTLKQKKLAKNIVKARSVKEAMLMSGYSESVARSRAADVVKEKGFKELLDKYGPTLNDAFKATKDGLTADKFVPRPDEPSVILPDHNIRLKAAEQTYKLHGVLQSDQAIQPGNLSITYVFSEPSHTQSESNTEQSIQIQDSELAQKSS